MGGFSIAHWLIVLIVALAFIIPLWKILTRLGYNGAWSLVVFLPFGIVLLLWVLAAVSWPIADANEEPVAPRLG